MSGRSAPPSPGQLVARRPAALRGRLCLPGRRQPDPGLVRPGHPASAERLGRPAAQPGPAHRGGPAARRPSHPCRCHSPAGRGQERREIRASRKRRSPGNCSSSWNAATQLGWRCSGPPDSQFQPPWSDPRITPSASRRQRADRVSAGQDSPWRGERSWDGADAAERGHRPAAGGGLRLCRQLRQRRAGGSNLVEVTKVSPGPLGVGSRFRYKARFAGREFELVREVIEYEPNRRQAVKTISGPLRFGGVRTFEAIPGGTRGDPDRWWSGGRLLRPGRAAAAARRPAVIANRPCHPQATAGGPDPSLAAHTISASRPTQQHRRGPTYRHSSLVTPAGQRGAAVPPPTTGRAGPPWVSSLYDQSATGQLRYATSQVRPSGVAAVVGLAGTRAVRRADDRGHCAAVPRTWRRGRRPRRRDSRRGPTPRRSSCPPG